MNPELLQKGFGSNTKRLMGFCEGISEDEAVFRPYDKVNHLKWEIGHLTNTRLTLIKILSPEAIPALFPNEREMFGYGSQPIAEHYPTLASLLEVFEERGKLLIELIGSTTPEHWASDSIVKVQGLGITVAEQLYFFLIHEAHHWGEISYLTNIIKRLR